MKESTPAAAAVASTSGMRKNRPPTTTVSMVSRVTRTPAARVSSTTRSISARTAGLPVDAIRSRTSPGGSELSAA